MLADAKPFRHKLL
jgi:hypothetical protein